MLPYLLLLLAFIGGMQLAIDATAGERERQSLEPLLATPATRAAIISGKILATAAFTLLSVLVTLVMYRLAFALVPAERVDTVARGAGGRARPAAARDPAGRAAWRHRADRARGLRAQPPRGAGLPAVADLPADAADAVPDGLAGEDAGVDARGAVPRPEPADPAHPAAGTDRGSPSGRSAWGRASCWSRSSGCSRRGSITGSSWLLRVSLQEITTEGTEDTEGWKGQEGPEDKAGTEEVRDGQGSGDGEDYWLRDRGASGAGARAARVGVPEVPGVRVEPARHSVSPAGAFAGRIQRHPNRVRLPDRSAGRRRGHR